MHWIRRILVPVDFSTASLAAYSYARFLADHVGATVDVLYAAAAQGMRGCSGSAGRGAGGATFWQVRAFLDAPADVRIIVADASAEAAVIAASQWDYEVVVVGGDGATSEQIREDAHCRVVTVWPPSAGSPVPFALDEPPSHWSGATSCGTAAGEAASAAG